MSELAKALAAPVEYESSSGEQVKLYPLTLNDLALFEQWVRAERMRAARDTGDEATIAIAMRQPIDSDAVTTEMGSFGGMQRLLWLSIRKGRKGITPEQVAELVPDFQEAGGLLIEVSGMGGDENESSDPPTESPPTGDD